MNRNIKKILCSIFCMVLMITIFQMPVFAGGDTVITSAAIMGIDAPICGETPDYSAGMYDPYNYELFTEFKGNNCINGITWMDVTNEMQPIFLKSNTTFKEGHKYSVLIYLKTKNDVKFITNSGGYSQMQVTVNGNEALASGINTSYPASDYIMVQYVFTNPVQGMPAAEISDGHISGMKNVGMDTDQKVTITLQNVSFDETFLNWAGDFSKDLDVSHWFINMPEGVKASLTSAYPANVTVLFTGLPRELCGDAIECKIPADCLMGQSSELYIESNESARWNIMNATDGIIDEVKINYLDYPLVNDEPDYSVEVPASVDYSVYAYNSSDEEWINGIRWRDLTDNCTVAKGDNFIKGHKYSIDIMLMPEIGCAFADVITGNTLYGCEQKCELITTYPAGFAMVTYNFVAGQSECTVSIQGYTKELGSWTGAGTYNAGDVVTVTATPKQGCRFINWSGYGDKILSEELEYTFTIYDDIQLYANFAGYEVTLQKLVDGIVLEDLPDDAEFRFHVFDTNGVDLGLPDIVITKADLGDWGNYDTTFYVPYSEFFIGEEDGTVTFDGYTQQVTTYVPDENKLPYPAEVLSSKSYTVAAAIKAVDGRAFVSFENKYICTNPEIIDKVDVINLDAPVIGAKPDYTADIKDNENCKVFAQYGTGGVYWFNITDNKAVNPIKDCFEKGKEYRVTVFLRSNVGSVFATEANNGAVPKMTINGLKGTYEYLVDHNDELYISVQRKFVPTEKAPEKPEPPKPPVYTDKVEAFVARLYNVCLNRMPDAAGLADWVSRLKNKEIDGISAAYGFVFSLEFKNKNLCNEDYVEQLYEAFMGRASDSVGKKDWVGRLQKGVTREEVFNGFALSVEFKNICEEYGILQGKGIEIPKYGTLPTGKCAVCGTEDGVTGFVRRLYNVCLNREPDSAGLLDWTGKLRAHTSSGSSVAYGFIFSQEFLNKNYNDQDYVEYLYKAFMGRASDPAGKADWTNRLEKGWTRKQVFDGFVGSQEFTNICTSYGILRD